MIIDFGSLEVEFRPLRADNRHLVVDSKLLRVDFGTLGFDLRPQKSILGSLLVLWKSIFGQWESTLGF